MELQQLQYFKTAAECENLSEAAGKLFISQPALSQTIQRLESDLGTPLFDRRGKTIRLNESGRVVLAYTNTVLRELDTMRQILAQKQSGGEFCVITDMPNMVRYVIPTFQYENSDVPLRVQFIEELRGGRELLEADVGQFLITDHPETIPGFVTEPLLQDRILLYVPPQSSLASQPWIDLSQLSAPTVLYSEGSQTTKSWHIIKKVLLDHCPTARLTPTMDVGSMTYLLKTTDALTFATAMTSLYWNPSHRTGVPVRGSDAVIQYYVTYPLHPTGTCQLFLNWLKNWSAWMLQMSLSKGTEIIK